MIWVAAFLPVRRQHDLGGGVRHERVLRGGGARRRLRLLQQRDDVIVATQRHDVAVQRRVVANHRVGRRVA